MDKGANSLLNQNMSQNNPNLLDLVLLDSTLKLDKKVINRPQSSPNLIQKVVNFPSKLEYNFYFGVPHAHTRYSDGKGTPKDAYEHAYKNGLDFLIVADHSNFLDGVKKRNYEYDKKSDEYIEKENSNWYNTRKDAEEINNTYKDFLALRGFEMSSYTGHINVINSKNYVEGKKQIKSLKKFFRWLLNQEDIVVSINHPSRSFNRLKYIPEMDKVINLIEVGNGAYPRKYIRTEKYYFEALDMGWHLGAINGQDNHWDNWGDSDNLTVVLAESLEKDKFLDALRSRRTYSTETRTLKLIFKGNGYWMGSILPMKEGEMLSFEIVAEDCSVPITKIQLISNGGKVFQEKNFEKVNIAQWNPFVQVNKNNSWYVIRVIHHNEKWGISSPIFIEKLS
jgi:hypothetical protein